MVCVWDELFMLLAVSEINAIFFMNLFKISVSILVNWVCLREWNDKIYMLKYFEKIFWEQFSSYLILQQSHVKFTFPSSRSIQIPRFRCNNDCTVLPSLQFRRNNLTRTSKRKLQENFTVSLSLSANPFECTSHQSRLRRENNFFRYSLSVPFESLTRKVLKKVCSKGN